MTSILTDSMAREHAQSLQAAAAASRRGRENRARRRDARRAERSRDRAAGRGTARRGVTAPFAAARAWLAAGQL